MKAYLSLIIWILALILAGSIIGYITKTEVNTWYQTLHISPLTPPSYIFSIVWTILYGIIGYCGWQIWSSSLPYLSTIKNLYIIQLILNFSWSILFFKYHLINISLISIVSIVIIVAILIYLCCQNLKLVSLLMTPYALWLLFATYLNFYISQHN